MRSRGLTPSQGGSEPCRILYFAGKAIRNGPQPAPGQKPVGAFHDDVGDAGGGQYGVGSDHDPARGFERGEGLDLAKLVDRIDADLWLIWSSPADPTRTCNSIESLGRSRRSGGRLPHTGPREVRVIGISIFHDLLPLPIPAHHLPLNPDEDVDTDADWPALPTADSPLPHHLPPPRRRHLRPAQPHLPRRSTAHG